MNLPNDKDISSLEADRASFCLSIYAPMIAPNGATNPNKIELKNLLKQARIALLSSGQDILMVNKTLKPARLLLEDGEFWPIHHNDLALFMNYQTFKYFHLPDNSVPYLITVDKHFNLGPLLNVVNDNREYFLLTLGHKNIKLFRGDHYGLKPLAIKNFPTELESALRIDEHPKWRETHAVAPSGKGSEAIHGQYNVSQTDKMMLVSFFRQIDRRLHRLLMSSRIPLVIAGVGYLLPIYQRVNTYSGLVRSGISGNFQRADLNTLRSKAWSLIKESGI